MKARTKINLGLITTTVLAILFLPILLRSISASLLTKSHRSMEVMIIAIPTALTIFYGIALLGKKLKLARLCYFILCFCVILICCGIPFTAFYKPHFTPDGTITNVWDFSQSSLLFAVKLFFTFGVVVLPVMYLLRGGVEGLKQILNGDLSGTK